MKNEKEALKILDLYGVFSASVDDNNDGELNAPELADFERIVRSRAVETAKRALKVVDSDGSGTVTMDEAKKIAFVGRQNHRFEVQLRRFFYCTSGPLRL